MNAAKGGNLSGGQLIPALFLLAVFVMSPLLLVRIPPLVDYPNHLARMHLLANLDQSPILQQYYEIDWAVLPNLAMDIIVPPMSRILPLHIAGKIFICLIFLLLITGTTALHRVLYGKISFWPLVSVFFLYNRAFLWGFLNFLFGVGVMIWLVAIWLACKDRLTGFRTVLFFVLAPVLFFSHLFAFGVYGLCIVAITVQRIRTDRSGNRWAETGIAMSQFVAPVMLFLFFCPTAEAVTGDSILFGGFARKLGALFQPLNNYNQPLDAISFLIIFGGIFIGILTRQIALSPSMRYPLALLALFFVIMPQHLLSVQAVDSRIPTPFAFLLVASTDPKWRNVPFKKVILAVCACLLVTRIGLIAFQWHGASVRYRHIETALSKIKNGSRLYTAIALSGQWQPFPVPLSHFPCIAIIKKEAFVPSLFAFSTQQPIRFSDNYIHLTTQTPGPMFPDGQTPDWSMISADYDYILMVNENNFNGPTSIRSARTVHAGPDFRLLQTR